MGTTPAEIVISFADKWVGRASLADTIVNLHNTQSERFTLTNEWGQAIATFSNAVRFFAPITLQANTYAATVTTLKIIVELNEGKGLNYGDVLNLAGNTLGIVATVTIMSGTAPVWVPTVATGVAVAIGAYSIFQSDNFGKLVNLASDLGSTFWPSQPLSPNINDLYMDNQGNYRRYHEIGPNEFGAYDMSAGQFNFNSVITTRKPTHQGVDDPWDDLPQRVAITV